MAMSQEDLKIFFWEKKIHLVLAILAKDIANQSYSLNTHWTYART